MRAPSCTCEGPALSTCLRPARWSPSPGPNRPHSGDEGPCHPNGPSHQASVAPSLVPRRGNLLACTPGRRLMGPSEMAVQVGDDKAWVWVHTHVSTYVSQKCGWSRGRGDGVAWKSKPKRGLPDHGPVRVEDRQSSPCSEGPHLHGQGTEGRGIPARRGGGPDIKPMLTGGCEEGGHGLSCCPEDRSGGAGRRDGEGRRNSRCRTALPHQAVLLSWQSPP